MQRSTSNGSLAMHDEVHDDYTANHSKQSRGDDDRQRQQVETAGRHPPVEMVRNNTAHTEHETPFARSGAQKQVCRVCSNIIRHHATRPPPTSRLAHTGVSHAKQAQWDASYTMRHIMQGEARQTEPEQQRPK